MRIEELILEGFKSYPVRTTINGWDSSFNAITGLNGSGKSNILDAICFVLGITNMTSVRASNLLDLIYKRGQAGVTKASVTIVFDNSERATSPVGFEDKRQITVTRQIAVGGLTKYLLNGHKTTLQVLQNLFQSVQLNINNPNFLIMQGKITKVLNMKPQEILGMVEEAAGTRMFEERKDKAVKTMAKKDKKVAEMESLLTEEIMPKLEALRNEKRSFLAFQKATSELERLLRLVKAYEWLEASKREAKSGETLETKKASLEEKKQLLVWLGNKQTKMEKEMGEILKKREKEMAKGGKLAGLMDAVKTLGLDIEKLKTQLEIKTKAISEEEDRLKAIEQTMSEIDSSRSSRSTKAESSTSAYDALKASFDATQAKLASDEELLQTLLTGLSSNSSSNDENAAGGYMGQLAEAKARLAAAGTESERARVEIGLGEKELKAMEPRAKKAASEGEGLGRELVEAKAEVEKLRKGLEGLGWDEEEEKALVAKREEVRGRIAELVEKRDSLRSRLAQTDFSYNDPHPNFDRSKVKGLVVNLIDLTPKNYASSTALEICAGGKLYNVIVQDEKVATSLLGNKQSLKKRVTLLPLNKIQAASVPKEKLAAAEKIAPNKVQTAISLVGYDDELSTAMSFVFGSTLICTDAEAASAITFNKSILLKSITLDGDVYDPSGMLSGGSAPKGGGVLVQVQKIREVERELEGLWATERELEGQLAKAKGVIEKFRKGKRELEIKQHEVGLLEEQVNGSNAAKIIAEVDALKASILKLKDVITQSRDKQNQAKADVKRLEKEMDDFKNNKDSKLNEIKASIVSQKKLVTKQSTALKAAQKDMQTAQLELEQLDQDLLSAAAEIEEVQSNLRRARSELATLEKEMSEVQSRYQTADAHLKSELATLAQFDEELNSLEADIKHKKDELTNVNLEVQKLDHEIVSATAERTKLRNRVSDLERTFTWIKDEHKSFGQPGSIYDFTKFDLATSRERVAELEEQQRGMKKKINPKVMTLIDNVEKKETALKKMMATVIKDKAKIEETITELDRYKRDALKTTWTKVNGDFGSIFAELLPGNFAKLQPPEGMDITEGLEVKIRLGSVWKASLTELSGGQRSLIALSLIMSLLQFKPAPMYILDEIDAALDLSHTQHIGSLFRNRFKGSQFIVVSLKEGLFTNANVLFKAKFVDGTSTVERTVTRSSNTFHQKMPAAAAATAPSRTSLANNAASRSRPAAAVPPSPAVGEEDESMAFDDGQEYSQFSQPTRKTPLVGR